MNDHNSFTYLPVPDILFSKVDDELVLYDHNRGLHDGVYVLDDIGARIWQLLVEFGDKTQVTQQLLHEFEVDERTVKAELDNLINQLIEQGFLLINPKREDA